MSKVYGTEGAVLTSLVASCKANCVEPWAYLKNHFTRLPQGEELESLLPDRSLEANPEHRWQIADRRAEERVRKGGL